MQVLIATIMAFWLYVVFMVSCVDVKNRIQNGPTAPVLDTLPTPAPDTLKSVPCDTCGPYPEVTPNMIPQLARASPGIPPMLYSAIVRAAPQTYGVWSWPGYPEPIEYGNLQMKRIEHNEKAVISSNINQRQIANIALYHGPRKSPIWRKQGPQVRAGSVLAHYPLNIKKGICMVCICGEDLVYCKCPDIDEKIDGLLADKSCTVFHDALIDIREQRMVLARARAFLHGVEFGFPNAQN